MGRYRIDICPIARKRTYLTFNEAEEWCFDGMTPYMCNAWQHWHVGHMPWWKQAWLNYEEKESLETEDMTSA